ncbi:outer membrane protein assembly factor BamC [Gammaproteobacteria bacterium]|nr:outer membrane protein assembly factor BamC [Gammaproteobacteria bacterium]MDB4056455.1 outer membrane protein assembly factor BamC [Gammaproteobacteria bacterium]MDC3379736.1 outer membrane protein assembly factor BamC [Gammaproteobacteria bacterium]
MKNIQSFCSFLLIICVTSCSYISGPEGMFPETKYKFFEEEVNSDLTLDDENLQIITDDHYPPITEGIAAAEEQDIPAPRQIFSSGESNEVQLRRLGELMWVYIETMPSTAWPIAKNYIEASSMSIITSNPDTGIFIFEHSENLNLQLVIEHGIKEASTEIFLRSNKNLDGVGEDLDSTFIQTELEKIVQYFASSVSSFAGTSLAAQNLNDRKKAKIFNLNNQTIIELDLGFDRAWSAVSRALTAGNITSNDIDRDNGIFLVSYSAESEKSSWFSFLNFTDNENNDSLLLNEAAEFKIILTTKEGKTNILVKSLTGANEEAEQLISKINELLS